MPSICKHIELPHINVSCTYPRGAFVITTFVQRFYLHCIIYHLFGRKYGDDGLPDGSSIHINMKGSAGQSFCAFMSRGVFVTLEGDANDYVGKVRIPADYETHIQLWNVALTQFLFSGSVWR